LKFLEHDWLAKADAPRGRFRNYLLAIWGQSGVDPNRSARRPSRRSVMSAVIDLAVLIREGDTACARPRSDSQVIAGH
jgi:hypothetical protein